MPSHNRALLVRCTAILMFLCSTQSQETFLSWKVTNVADYRSVDVHFTRDSFEQFYSWLCDQSTRQCTLPIGSQNFLSLKEADCVVNESPSNATRYLCSHDFQMPSITCTKVNSCEGRMCGDTQDCLRYFIDESLQSTKCDLPFVEISSTSDVTIHLSALNSSSVNLKIMPCALDISSSSSSSSSSPSSSSRKKTTIIIGSSAGIFGSLIVLVIACLVLFLITQRRSEEKMKYPAKGTHTVALNTTVSKDFGGGKSNSENIVYENQLMTTTFMTSEDNSDINSDSSVNCIHVDVHYENQMSALTTVNENKDSEAKENSNEDKDNNNDEDNNSTINTNDNTNNNSNNDDKNSNDADGYTDCESQPTSAASSANYFNALPKEDSHKVGGVLNGNKSSSNNTTNNDDDDNNSNDIDNNTGCESQPTPAATSANYFNFLLKEDSHTVDGLSYGRTSNNNNNNINDNTNNGDGDNNNDDNNYTDCESQPISLATSTNYFNVLLKEDCHIIVDGVSNGRTNNNNKNNKNYNNNTNNNDDDDNNNADNDGYTDCEPQPTSTAKSTSYFNVLLKENTPEINGYAEDETETVSPSETLYCTAESSMTRPRHSDKENLPQET